MEILRNESVAGDFSERVTCSCLHRARRHASFKREKLLLSTRQERLENTLRGCCGVLDVQRNQEGDQRILPVPTRKRQVRKLEEEGDEARFGILSSTMDSRKNFC